MRISQERIVPKEGNEPRREVADLLELLVSGSAFLLEGGLPDGGEVLRYVLKYLLTTLQLRAGKQVDPNVASYPAARLSDGLAYESRAVRTNQCLQPAQPQEAILLAALSAGGLALADADVGTES